jgi:glutathione S-transferase
MALAAAGVRVYVREIILRAKPADMLALSPKGSVPVLVLDHSTPMQRVIDESLDVMQWALQQHDPMGWIPPADAKAGQGIADHLALIAENDGVFKYHLDRYKYPDRYEDIDPQYHRGCAMAFLQILSDRIAQHGGGLFAARWMLADYAIMPFVRQFRIADIPWFDQHAPQALRQWLQVGFEDALFQAIMHKFPLWQPESFGVVCQGRAWPEE